MKSIYKIFGVIGGFLLVFSTTMYLKIENAKAFCAIGNYYDHDSGCTSVNTSGIQGSIGDSFLGYVYQGAASLAWVSVGLSVITIVLAGMKYSTSKGDPKVIEEAKMLLWQAFIGLLITMMAFVIVDMIASLIFVPSAD